MPIPCLDEGVRIKSPVTMTVMTVFSWNGVVSRDEGVWGFTIFTSCVLWDV